MSSESSSTDEVEELRALVEAAHKRIDHLETQIVSSGASASGGGYSGSESAFDGRDQAVLEQLEAGQTVSAADLKQLYRSQTDIRSPQTLKNRLKTLTNHDAFEHQGPGSWRYRGEPA